MSKLSTSLSLIVFLTFTANAFAMEGDKSTYVLAVGEGSVVRRQLLHNLVSEQVEKHLKLAELKEGQTIWDLGGGEGSRTRVLAEKVGENGHVHVLEISPEQIATSRKYLEAAGLANRVTFHQGDVTSPNNDLPEGMADGVYISLVLSHIKQPELALALSMRLLKRGGFIATQEVTKSDTYSNITSASDDPIKIEAYNLLKNRIAEGYKKLSFSVAKKLGTNPDLGKIVESLHKEAGFVDPKVFSYQPTVDMETFKKYFDLETGEWGDKVVAGRLLDRDELELWKNTVRNLPNDETFKINLSNYVFYAAKKPN